MEDEIPEEKVNPKEYWKCNACGQVVEIEFDTCWNCQEGRPIEIQSPSNDEILQYLSDGQSSLDPENYWKCPKCGEIVENDFDMCWNCENENNASVKIEAPSVEEIINYQSDNKSTIGLKPGFLVIFFGIIVIAFSGLGPISESLGFDRIYVGRLIFGFLFIVIGIFVLIVGILKR
jgi:sarcosine oxidase delta subunit